MESTAIKKGQISGSSGTEKARPDQARLNLRKSKHSQGAWIPEDDDYNAWLQVHLHQRNVLITAVATQGLEERSKWVTKYKLQYWRRKTNVQYYKDPQQSGPFKVINWSLLFLFYSSFILNVRKLTLMASFLPKAINNRFSVRLRITYNSPTKFGEREIGILFALGAPESSSRLLSALH